jgi:hypothetical protein
MANPNLSVRIYPETLRFASAAFIADSGGLARIGGPLEYPCRLLYIVNNTDVLLTFSVDGVNAHWVIFAGGFLLLDVTSNRTETGGAFALAEGTSIYVEGEPTTGDVYVSSFYGSNTI